MENQDKLLSAAAYLFFVPALYIILTEKRKLGFNAHHAAQALCLWIVFILALVLLRFLLSLEVFWLYYPLLYFKNLVTALFAGYCIFCALKAVSGKSLEVPLIFKLVNKL